MTMKREEDIRREAGAWLAAHPPAPLAAPTQPDEAVIKAGILPFLPAPSPDGWKWLFMRPVAEHPHLPPPPLQICKGTRMGLSGGKWKDVKKKFSPHDFERLETPAETALREGVEELGLELSAILRLYDLGDAEFSSASTGKKKSMRLFAAELADERHLLPMESVEPSTAERRWCSLQEFAWQARPDHLDIVEKSRSMLDGQYPG